MAKKLISVWLSLTIFIFSSISIYADENIRGDFFVKTIDVNGEKIVNYELQYPFFTHNGAVYFPLTADMGKICGFEVKMDWESRTLKILKTESTQKNISERWLKNNNEDVYTQMLSNVKVLAYGETESDTPVTEEDAENAAAAVTDAGIGDADKVDAGSSGEELDLGGLPILMKGKTIFLPIRTMTGSSTLNWDSHFDSYYGICISTKDGVPAQNYWNQAESNYNKGLVKYIQSYNKANSTEFAQELVFLFKRAADVYNIDEKLLMAVAQTESTFRPSAKSVHGARGLMQVMPATAAPYGISGSQLLDPKTNIDFGARYLSEGVAKFNGNEALGLTAYNQGPGAVSRGGYSTAYANRVMGAKGSIQTFLTSYGYGMGN